MKKVLLAFLAAALITGPAFAGLGSIITSFRSPGGYGLWSVAISDKYLYVYKGNGYIYNVHPTTGSIYGSYTSSAHSSSGGGLTYCADGGQYLYAGRTLRTVFCKTIAGKGTIVRVLNAPTNTQGLAGIAQNDGGRGLLGFFVASDRADYLWRLNLSGGVVGSFRISPRLYGLAYDWRNKLIFGGYTENVIYGYDTTGSLAASFTTPSKAHMGLAYYNKVLWLGSRNEYIYLVECPGNVGVKPSSMGKIKTLFR